MAGPGICRFTLSLGTTDHPTTGWELSLVEDMPAPPTDPYVLLRDPTGHLALVGRLSDVDQWATDLVTTLTMTQIRLHSAAGSTGAEGGPTNDRDSDQP